MASQSAHEATRGVKGVRAIKATNTSSLGPTQSSRLQKRKQETYAFFVEKVDPILGDCITQLLIEQPADVPTAMINYLKLWSAKAQGLVPDPQLQTPEQWPAVKPRKEMKVFLATSIGPVVAKLVNRLAVSLPASVVDFMIQELQSMQREDALIPDRVDPSPAPVPPSEPATSVSSTVDVVVADSPKPVSLNIAVLGVGGAGKTTIVNHLQGKLDPHTKPTVGFRPVSFAYNKHVTVRIYDLGGGSKIRDIWKNYYHDTHGIIYTLDATVAEEDQKLFETMSVVETTLQDKYLRGKPLLIFANKQDQPGARPAAYWQDVLAIPEEFDENLFIAECSAFIPENVDSQSYQADPNIESAVNMLLQSVLEHHPKLHARVQADCEDKAKEEARQRLERERRVLKSKIASAFVGDLDAEIVAELQAEADPNNIFTVEEGETFLAAEIGEEQLLPVAQEVARMVGYQRLALQIVGALKVPISKKKVPMSWEEIHQLVAELRSELRLP